MDATTPGVCRAGTMAKPVGLRRVGTVDTSYLPPICGNAKERSRTKTRSKSQASVDHTHTTTSDTHTSSAQFSGSESLLNKTVSLTKKSSILDRKRIEQESDSGAHTTKTFNVCFVYGEAVEKTLRKSGFLMHGFKSARAYADNTGDIVISSFPQILRDSVEARERLLRSKRQFAPSVAPNAKKQRFSLPPLRGRRSSMMTRIVTNPARGRARKSVPEILQRH